ncbi:MAG: hypothetical protein KC425_08720, partial [Anaerolineales bacterium]|nr:hypothetical protein [Anaerolineales bacterium]
MTADDNLNPLSVFLDSGHPYAPSDDIAGFLTLAIQLTTAVQDVHRRVPAHGALNPAIIFVAAPSGTPAARQVQILDPHLAAARGLSTQLAYMAPEQTGRMNRTVDHRTDLYALGAIFYQALTGRLPFPGRDLQALVYAHIATKPIPPVQVRATLPRALSDMIL